MAERVQVPGHVNAGQNVVEVVGEDHLSSAGQPRESARRIDHIADQGVVLALGRADIPHHRAPVADAHAHADLHAQILTPGGGQVAERTLHIHCGG